MPLLVNDFGSRSRSFLAYFIIGILFYATRLFWILFFEVEPGIRPLLVIGYILMVLYLSAYYGLFGLVLRIFREKSPSPWLELIFVPSLWVSLEFLRETGALGFPWSPLWLTALPDVRLIQVSALFGAFSISWLIMFVNACVCCFIKHRNHVFLLLPAVLVLLCECYGLLRVKRSNEPVGTLKVAIFQPNVLPREYFSEPEWLETVKAYRELDEMLKDTVDLIIFSESALPGYYRYSKRCRKLVGEILERHKSFLLLGSSDRARSTKGYRLYNSAFLLDSLGEFVGRYDKTHLVPFGEWLPYEDKIPFLRHLEFGQGDYSPGEDIRPIKFDDHSLGVLICFESIFPEISRIHVLKGAKVLVNITNDGWFGKSLGPIEHFHLARFRAVETGRYLVRAGKTGISAVIDDKGRIVEKLDLFTRGVLVAEVPELGYTTLFCRIGHVFPILSVLIVVILLFIMVKKPRLKNIENKRGGQG